MRQSARSYGAGLGAAAVGARGAAERRAVVRATGLLCLGGLIAGSASSCGQPAPARHPPSQSALATIDPNRAVEVAVLAAYSREEAAFEYAIRHADPGWPDLSTTMADPLLQIVTANLRADQAAGIESDNGKIDHNPRIVSVEGTSAVVADCEWDAAALVYVKSGEKVPPVVPAEHVGVRATLVQTSPGTWKVSKREVTEGSCPSTP